MVTPVMTQRGLIWLDELCQTIGPTGEAFELVANDYGVLDRISGCPTATPVVGRFLGRTVIDLLQDRLSLSSGQILELLRERYGVNRFEISCHRRPFTGSDLEGTNGCRLSLHYPYHCLTLSRSCVFRYGQTAQDVRMDSVPCDGLCPPAYRLTYPGFIEEDLLLKGNAVFVSFGEPAQGEKSLASLGFDRLVYAPDVPL